MAKIDEKVLWGAAVKLRDKCDPADYKNVVLGLVFLKYVSDKYLAKFNELKSFGDGRELDEDYYIAEHVFIVPEKRFGLTLHLIQKMKVWVKKLTKHLMNLKRRTMN